MLRLLVPDRGSTLRANTVLLIGGSPADAALVREAVASGGGRCRHERSLADGLAAISESAVACVLIDPELPDGGGLSAVEAVLGVDPDGALPVVVLTGPDEADLGRAAMQAGAEDHLVLGELPPPAVTRSIQCAIERTRRRETSLRRATRSAAIAEALEEGVLIQDRDGRLLEANAAACRLFGVERAGLVRDPPVAPRWTAIRADGTPFPMGESPGRRVVTTGVRQAGVVMGITADGGPTRWAEITAAPVPPSAGYPEGSVVVSVRDITERRIAEEEIAFQANLLGAAGQAIIATDPKGLIRYWNPAATGLYGWTAGEVQGRPIGEVTPSDGSAARAVEIFAELRAGRTWSGEFEVVHRDGHTIPVLCANTPMFDASGELVAVIGVSTDLTELAAANRTRAFLSAIVESSNDAIMAATLDGNITAWNVAAERLFGYSRAETLGMPSSIADGLGLATGVQATLDAIGEDAGAGNQQTQQRTRDGRIVDLALTLSPVRDADGASIGISGIFRDITEQLRLQAEADENFRRLVEAEREAEQHALKQAAAEQANRMKDEFLSRMSHELRTPLNAVLGFSQLLLRGSLVGRERESVSQILRAGRHLLSLIDDVLDISIIESGELQLSIEPLVVEALVASAIELVETTALSRGIEVTTRDIDPALAVTADRKRVLQILLNLLSNAVKFNHEGGLVEVSSGRSGASVRIAVTDSGPGIAPDDLERAFRPFDRLGVERGDVEGSGVGLALCRSLAERMGASVGVHSVLGQGSTFWCDLPPGEVTDRPPPPVAVEAPPKADRRPLVVLYIEDNEASRDLVQLQLEATYDLTLITATDGGQGLALAHVHHPDLILLDVNLPGLSGVDVLAGLHGDARTDSIPVAVLSADATARSRQDLFDAGARHYLTKPIDLDEFDEVIASMFKTVERLG